MISRLDAGNRCDIYSNNMDLLEKLCGKQLWCKVIAFLFVDGNVGTPSQYTSADKVRMGRITGMGKDSVRVALVEASWWLIRKDKAMGIKYEKIKARAGAKRAIVAVARILLLRIRRMILDGQPYAFA